jgi:hypothetical protein
MQTDKENGIHCKVFYNGQFRRFLFNGTEFTSLYSQVKQLLALESEFVLKYKDNEDDLITMSSNEEIGCALSFSEGNVLRLFVEQQGQGMDVECPVIPTLENRGCRGRWHGRGRGLRCKDERRLECKKARISLKRDWLKSMLDSFPKDTPLSPEQQHRKKMLETKLNRLNSLLTEKMMGYEEKIQRKCCKEEWKKNKEEWKKNKKEMKDVKKMKEKNENLSPAALEEISLLKVQIDSTKPEICELKKQIKAKKNALKECQGDPSTLWKEIYDLKMKVLEKRNLIYPIKLRIREIRNSAC